MKDWILIISSIPICFLIAIGIGVYAVDDFNDHIGKVVSINSWEGSDLTHYYNVTVSYQGKYYTQVITCNYYHVNDSLPLSFTQSGRYLGFESYSQQDRAKMPIGC